MGYDLPQWEENLKDSTLSKLASQVTGRSVDVGTAVMPHLLEDEQYRETLRTEFNTIVPEHHMKWDPMCPVEGKYDFGPVDKVVDWGNANGMRVKAHTLLWHVTSPAWLNEKSPEELRESLRRHIYTTVSHFRGRVKCWDVVNEALAPDGTLAKTIFLEKLGVNVYDDAFKWAREADPNVKLIYNDNKIEGFNPQPNDLYCESHSKKANAMFELVSGMKERGVPIDGVGLQAHFDASGCGLKRPPTPESMINNIKRYSDIGLSVNISEMDVRISKLPNDVDKTIAQQEIYHDTLSSCLSMPNFEGITYWGFTDKHTWVSDFYYQDSPLLWDTEYNRKPAYYAVAHALWQAKEDSDSLVVPRYLNTICNSTANSYWGTSWMQPEPTNQSNNEIGDDSNAAPDWVLDDKE